MPGQTAVLATTATIKRMADGLNEARALRVTELMRDYQNIQRRISQIQASPHSDEYHEVGYTILRQCHAEARVLLNTPYPPEMLHPPTGPNETEKRQLQRVIVDGSARRFQAQKINLKAAAAMKWINKRNSILQGQKPRNSHIPQLQQADNTLRSDLATITDSRIVNGFRSIDQQAGYWLNEDPSLQTILSWIRSQH
ncbi:hypothetical protein OEA41_006923 [Lepraria neglecta]|uniref:Uncharacterized protein n=1 Tax=Lepraria neglecta TaxID=209136 RepID=A0AAE0DL11_9LECA|nr:hypothetical protein OEA41_006923 [Lepraria neglecta]